MFDNFSPVEVLETDRTRDFLHMRHRSKEWNSLQYILLRLDKCGNGLTWIWISSTPLVWWIYHIVSNKYWQRNPMKRKHWGSWTSNSKKWRRVSSFDVIHFTPLKRLLFFLLWLFEIWFALSPTLGHSNIGEEIPYYYLCCVRLTYMHSLCSICNTWGDKREGEYK